MDSIQDPTPALTCSKCGKQNKLGRLFCQFCGTRLLAPAPPDPEPQTETTLPEESQGLLAALHAAQDDNQTLRQQLKSTQEELDRSKRDGGTSPQVPEGFTELAARLKEAEGKAAAFELQAAEWESKYNSAVRKPAPIENQVVVKDKGTEGIFGRRLKLIAGALVIMCVIGGYAAGRYFTKIDPGGKSSQLLRQLKVAQAQNRDLKSQMASASAELAQLRNDSKSRLDFGDQKMSELTRKLAAADGRERAAKKDMASAQNDLASTRSRLQKEHSTEVLLRQKQADTAAANLRLQAAVRSRDKQISILFGRVATLRNAAPARTGYLIWTGTIVGKRKIEIKDGKTNYGVVTSGALPRSPCTVTASDPGHVQLKTLPSKKNRWNRISFEVSARGPVQVRIDWALSR